VTISLKKIIGHVPADQLQGLPPPRESDDRAAPEMTEQVDAATAFRPLDPPGA
jgi:hypothetical protein